MNQASPLFQYFLLEPSLYWQLGAALVCLALSYLLTQAIRFSIKKHIQTPKSLWDRITKSCFPMVFPTLTLLLAALNASILSHFFSPITITQLFFQLCVGWFIFQAGWLLSSNLWIAILLITAIIPPMILKTLGIRDTATAYLDQISLTIGKFDLSLLMVIKTVFILAIALWVGHAISRLMKSYLHSAQHLTLNTKELIGKLLDIGIYFIIILTTFHLVGIDLTAFAVLGGAIGVGIGVGLQRIIANFLSGMILLMERTVEVGDLVELEGGVLGYVRHMGGRATFIESLDGRDIMIPNEDFITKQVTNWTYRSNRARVEVRVGISYSSDVEKAKELIIEAATEHPLCLKDPAPACFLREFGESSLNLLLFFYVEDVTQGRYGPQSDVMIAIWKKFKANQIEIPFPQRDVWIKQTPVTHTSQKLRHSSQG